MTPTPKPARQRPAIELQIHPSSIRRSVQYLFFSRTHLGLIGGGVLAYVAFLLLALIWAPSVIGTRLRADEFQAMQENRERLGERVGALSTRMQELLGWSDELHLRMEKIYLAYGLSQEERVGQGGYPGTPRPLGELAQTPRVQRAAMLEAQLEERARVLDTFLREIQSFEETHSEDVATTPSLSPLQGSDFVLTSPYGMRTNPFTKERDFHAGIDFAAEEGTPVVAPADGVVSFAGRYSLKTSVSWWRYGNLVTLRHGDRFVTLYGHLDEVLVQRGDQVRQGDVVGTVGSTGWSTNPHLHYEVRRVRPEERDRPIDPRIYILDHQWRDDEKTLIRARSAPSAENYEPLPRSFTR